MKITQKQILIKDLLENYKDDGDDGVYAYKDRLCCRPKFQRAFVYGEKQRAMVISSVLNDRPLNVMYWSRIDDDNYEIIDGQQRTISICQYATGDFPVKINGNDKFFHNLNETEKEQFLNYPLFVYVCDGTEAEKLEWFETINIVGATLTKQELLNATYTGPFISDAKNYFSKRNCVAMQMAEGYLKGNPIRQEVLEKVLAWIADRDGLKDGQAYMAIHQKDKDANEMWIYFDEVISWAKRLFPNRRKGITDAQEWGLLYNKYHTRAYNTNSLEEEVKKLILDDDVTKRAGIIGYVLSDKTPHDERLLSLRAFTENQKIRAYERQNGICPICGQHFEIDEMEADHVLAWSAGGHTTDDNLQMLCKQCNLDKSDS